MYMPSLALEHPKKQGVFKTVGCLERMLLIPTFTFSKTDHLHSSQYGYIAPECSKHINRED